MREPCWCAGPKKSALPGHLVAQGSRRRAAPDRLVKHLRLAPRPPSTRHECCEGVYHAASASARQVCNWFKQEAPVFEAFSIAEGHQPRS